MINLIYHKTIRLLEQKEGRELVDDEKKAVSSFAHKKVIASRFEPKVRKIYNDMILEYLSMYNGGNFDFNILRRHFKPRFLAIITEIYLYNTKVFGRKIRNELGFNKFGYKQFTTTEDDINRDFDTEISKNILEDADRDADEVLDTAISDIKYYTDKAWQDENTQLESQKKKLNEIIQQIALISFGIIALNKTQLYNLNRQKESLEKEVANLQRNPLPYVKRQIASSLKKRFKSRAKITTEQEVGISQSMVEQTEASVISSQQGFFTSKTGKIIAYSKLISKKWISILDSRTRQAHAAADGQTVNTNDFFVVMLESLLYPRDPRGSAKNTINCRCEAVYGLNI